MELEYIKKLRDICDKVTYTVRNADGSTEVLKAPIHIMCDNSLSCLDNRVGSVIWNDADQYFVYFKLANDSTFYNAPTDSMSFGNQPLVPLAAIFVDYSEIQNLRIIMNAEMFKNLTDNLPTIKSEEIEWVWKTYFEDLNAINAIKRKRNISYTTQRPIDSKEEKKHYDGLDEYTITTHPANLM